MMAESDNFKRIMADIINRPADCVDPLVTHYYQFCERRVHTRKLIDKMLNTRRQLLILLCKVSALFPFLPDRPIDQQLQEFCQILIDYVAAGHFGLYQRIADGNERRQPVLSLACHIYPEICRTTDTVIKFNDKYTRMAANNITRTLECDLSELSEVMTTRIELEDQLICAMFMEAELSRYFRPKQASAISLPAQ
jgi:regulator of sigma D